MATVQYGVDGVCMLEAIECTCCLWKLVECALLEYGVDECAHIWSGSGRRLQTVLGVRETV